MSVTLQAESVSIACSYFKMSVGQSICLFVFPSVCPSVCLSVCQLVRHSNCWSVTHLSRNVESNISASACVCVCWGGWRGLYAPALPCALILQPCVTCYDEGEYMKRFLKNLKSTLELPSWKTTKRQIRQIGQKRQTRPTRQTRQTSDTQSEAVGGESILRRKDVTMIRIDFKDSFCLTKCPLFMESKRLLDL